MSVSKMQTSSFKKLLSLNSPKNQSISIHLFELLHTVFSILSFVFVVSSFLPPFECGMILCRSRRWAYLTGIPLAWCCVVLPPLVRSRLAAVVASLPRAYNPSDGHSVVRRGIKVPNFSLYLTSQKYGAVRGV